MLVDLDRSVKFRPQVISVEHLHYYREAARLSDCDLEVVSEAGQDYVNGQQETAVLELGKVWILIAYAPNPIPGASQQRFEQRLKEVLDAATD
jgi:hypothetical protein